MPNETPGSCIEIPINFTVDTTLQQLQTVPQSKPLLFIYQHTHTTGGMGMSLDRHMDSMRERLDMLEENDDLRRIIIDEKPISIDEEEVLKVWKLRSAFTRLGWQWLAASTIPDEIKIKFSTDKEHLESDELTDAIESLRRWSEENPEKDTPLVLTSEMEEQVRKIFTRGVDLITFYNQHKPFFRTTKQDDEVTEELKAFWRNPYRFTEEEQSRYDSIMYERNSRWRRRILIANLLHFLGHTPNKVSKIVNIRPAQELW